VLLDTFGQPTGGFGLQLYITLSNTLFLFTAISAAYGMVGAASVQIGLGVGLLLWCAAEPCGSCPAL